MVSSENIDILLVTINAKWIHPSLALRLLKANLGTYENRAVILEFALRQPLQEKLDPIVRAVPKILGISVSIWNHKGTLELLKALHNQWHEERPVVILGGPEVSYLPEQAEIIRYADWVIRGEGELVFRELCEVLLSGASLSALRASAAVQRISGKMIDAYPVDITAIEPGYRLYTAEDLTRKLTYIEASRGCAFGCEFCLSSQSKVREFGMESFVEEMKALIHQGAKSFKFLDRTFNFDIPRAKQIMAFFLDYLKPPMYVHFEMVPTRFPPELRDVLQQFPPGTLRLELGIQTFNQHTASLIGRKSDPETELEVLRFLREKTTALVHADLIAGLPGEDLASFAAGFDRLWLAQPQEIQVGILKCLPGTPIVRHNQPFGMRYASEPPYEILETSALSAKDIDRIKNFARFWELIVNRGAFNDLRERLFPNGQPLFYQFMALSDRLLQCFGRNWGIDHKDLRKALELEQPFSNNLVQKLQVPNKVNKM
jgi:radical SAM superfamily enzyme YgiQ (UPF0313 family)